MDKYLKDKCNDCLQSVQVGPYPGVFRLQVVRHNPKTSRYVRTGSLRDERLPSRTQNISDWMDFCANFD